LGLYGGNADLPRFHIRGLAQVLKWSGIYWHEDTLELGRGLVIWTILETVVMVSNREGDAQVYFRRNLWELFLN
jgi:hypothetical protein